MTDTSQASMQSFMPFVVTADGTSMGYEAKAFMRLQNCCVWPKSHREVLGYLHARMLFAVLQIFAFVAVE